MVDRHIFTGGWSDRVLIRDIQRLNSHLIINIRIEPIITKHETKQKF